jgi:glycerol uptake facilitator-like aquaporin
MMRTVRLLLSETIGSAVLAVVFGVLAIYNFGIAKSFSGPDEAYVSSDVISSDADDDDPAGPIVQYYGDTLHVMDPWVQAFIVGFALLLVYIIGSKIAKRHLHLNPFVSTACVGIELAHGENRLSWIGELFALWLAQAVGAFGGASVVYAFSSNTLSGIIQYVGQSVNVDDPSTLADEVVFKSGIFWRSFFAEIVAGTIGLLFVAYFAKRASTAYMKSDSGSMMQQCDFTIWSMAIAGFYFFFMMVFWVHTKSTVDFLRTGAYCVFGQFDSDASHCSSAGFAGFDYRAGLYVFQAMIQVAIIISAFLLFLFIGLSDKKFVRKTVDQKAASSKGQ